MQIHEIARRNINEGPLKGVATNVVKPVVNYAVDQAKGVAKLPLNTAEYFANKILDTAGVPAAQQGKYSKYGHMAAGQNKGTASIAKAENEIATEIAKEWARLGTLNGQKVELPLDSNQIALAAGKLNTGKLQLNTNNIVANVQKMAPEQRSLLDLYKKNPATAPTKQPADTATNPAAGNNAFGQMATQLTTPAPAPAPVPKPAPAPVPKPALPPSNNPFGQMATQLGKKSELEPAMAESLIWSKNFDPSKELYRRMKQGQTQ
jgi:hypothetical protein